MLSLAFVPKSLAALNICSIIPELALDDAKSSELLSDIPSSAVLIAFSDCVFPPDGSAAL